MMTWELVQPTGPESAEDELIEQSASALADVLAKRPSAVPTLLDVVGRRLAGVPNLDTWETLRNAVTDLVGPEAAGLVLWASVTDGRDEDRMRRLERIEATGQAEAVEAIRALRATHGRELQEAWERFGEIPNSWRSIDREVYVDFVRGRPYLRLTLTKFSGEQIGLEGTGDSILNLAGYLAQTLAVFGDRAGFTEGMISYYLEATETLRDILEPKESAATGGEQHEPRPIAAG